MSQNELTSFDLEMMKYFSPEALQKEVFNKKANIFITFYK